MPHLSELTEINPFVYTVNTNGTIVDNGSMTQAPWPALIAAAKAQKVRVVPTVMWSNGTAIYNILSVAKTRQALETNIANLAKKNGYDGIDIDFEDKTAATEPYFSLFPSGPLFADGQQNSLPATSKRARRSRRNIMGPIYRSMPDNTPTTIPRSTNTATASTS